LDTRTFPDETAALWEAYRARGSAEARERLILLYAPLVKYVAGRIRSRAPGYVEQAELTSVGIFGLIDAIQRFDPARGVRFESYALTRIRGAILDELRRVDRVPRSVRATYRRIEEAEAELQSELKRTPTDEEVAAHLGLEIAVVRDVMRRVGEAAVLGLDQIVYSSQEDGAALIDRVTGMLGEPSAGPAAQERRTLVVDAINALEERERIVVTLYYYGGMTLGDIAEVLGLSEARVCQIRSKAVQALRGAWS
jgi:RNA polymerase sigma factor for flagellar operon FliA